ncbi:MAG: DNA alkylation repair protein [Chloroflexota bacterium]
MAPDRGLIAALERELEARADPERAPALAAYMKNLFAFYGIYSAGIVEILRAHVPREVDSLGLAEVTWLREQREWQYLGLRTLLRDQRRLGPEALPGLERLVTAKSWWDTVDGLATGVVGPLVQRNPELGAVMDRWIESEDIWLARTAILHQERWKLGTGPERLFAYCGRRAGEREFFIRKAIGWALRSYPAVAPEAVRDFVAANPGLSGLSRREATRGVERALAAGQPRR